MIKIVSKIVKIIGALSIVALLAGQVLSAPLKTGALAPRFNFLDGDKELFTGLNHTAGETVYTDPVTSNGSDEIVGLIYYHNGVVDTTAHNTTFNVTLPQTTDSLAKTLTASITADNADPMTVSDTIVNGNIVGKSGLTINVPTNDAKISFVPDSVRWFPDKSETPVALPAGVNGNDLVTPGGLNIGDVQGCWNFSGYIAFGLTVTTPVHPVALTIDKTVRNETLDQPFVKADQARPGDILTYQVIVKNTGESNANKVTIRDFLPPHVTLLPDTIHLFVHGSGTESPFPDGNGPSFINNGVSIGDLPMGEAMSTKLVFSVKVDNDGLHDGQVLVNKAEAYFNNLNVSDTAQTTIVITAPLFQQSKTAFNITQNVDATLAPAKPGDIIQYRLYTKNVGTAAGEITPTDGIADVLEYASIDQVKLTDAGATIINRPDAVDEDDQIQIVFPKVSIAPGDGVIGEFNVQVKNPLPTNPTSGHHFDFVMYNFYGNAVVVHITPPVVINPVLTLTKDVRDVTTNDLNFSNQDEIFAGDTLEYRLIISNTSSVPTNAVKIIDTLPANVSYIPGTTVLTANGTSVTLGDGITGTGITLPQIPANTVYTIFLRAKVDSGVAANICLANSATVTSGNINISDQAQSCTQALASATVTPPTETPANLPVTGTGGMLATIFGSFFLLSNLLYFTGKKKLLATAILAHS
jgi:uncharacterized repeat protein (TIGR01451 family)